MKPGIHATEFMRFYGAHSSYFAHDRHELSLRLEQRKVRYGKRPVSFEMAPILLAPDEHTRLATASEAILRAAECFSRLVVRTPEWHAAFPWTEAFLNVALHPPGYSYDIPCARLDAFLIGDRIVFLELNTDGSSYMAYADVFHEEYRNLMAQRPETGLADLAYDVVMPGVLETLRGCYAEFRAAHPGAGLPAQPVVGIMDWPGEPTAWEFTTLARQFRLQGVETHVVSPDRATFDGRVLSFDGRAVHLIYRRLLGVDYAARMDALEPVTTAFMRRAVCMVGAPRSQIAFSKKLFAFLRDPRVQAVLPDDCIAAVNAHIPWTWVLAPGPATVHDTRVDLVPFVRAQRDQFVLKPCESKLGAGIHVGKFMDQAAWDVALDAALREDYVVQEFVPLASAPFPRFAPTREPEKRYLHLGAYVFGGTFRGLLGRTCAHAVLNARHGERLTAVLVRGCVSPDYIHTTVE